MEHPKIQSSSYRGQEPQRNFSHEEDKVGFISYCSKIIFFFNMAEEIFILMSSDYGILQSGLIFFFGFCPSSDM